MNSLYSSNLPGAKQLGHKEFNKFCSPKSSDDLCLFFCINPCPMGSTHNSAQCINVYSLSPVLNIWMAEDISEGVQVPDEHVVQPEHVEVHEAARGVVTVNLPGVRTSQERLQYSYSRCLAQKKDKYRRKAKVAATVWEIFCTRDDLKNRMNCTKMI